MISEKKRIDSIFASRKNMDNRYSLKRPGNLYNLETLIEEIKNFLRLISVDYSNVNLLDIGSGELFWPEVMAQLGLKQNNCFGTDLLHWRMVEGRRKGRSIAATTASAFELPFASNSFDLVSQFTLMTSILGEDNRKLAVSEMIRVLKPGGYVLWYDFRYNNPFNKNTLAIGRKELKSLFHDMNIITQTITVIPQIARKTPAFALPLLKFLNLFPILRTHYLAIIGPKE